MKPALPQNEDHVPVSRALVKNQKNELTLPAAVVSESQGELVGCNG
jgi:hypothetical protein